MCWCAAQARECGACGCGVCANVCCVTAVPCCRASTCLVPASSRQHPPHTVPLPAVIPEKRVFVVLSPAIFHVVGFWGRNSKLMQVGSRSSFSFQGKPISASIKNNYEQAFYRIAFFAISCGARKCPQLPSPPTSNLPQLRIWERFFNNMMLFGGSLPPETIQ